MLREAGEVMLKPCYERGGGMKEISATTRGSFGTNNMAVGERTNHNETLYRV